MFNKPQSYPEVYAALQNEDFKTLLKKVIIEGTSTQLALLTKDPIVICTAVVGFYNKGILSRDDIRCSPIEPIHLKAVYLEHPTDRDLVSKLDKVELSKNTAVLWNKTLFPLKIEFINLKDYFSQLKSSNYDAIELLTSKLVITDNIHQLAKTLIIRNSSPYRLGKSLLDKITKDKDTLSKLLLNRYTEEYVNLFFNANGRWMRTIVDKVINSNTLIPSDFELVKDLLLKDPYTIEERTKSKNKYLDLLYKEYTVLLKMLKRSKLYAR